MGFFDKLFGNKSEAPTKVPLPPKLQCEHEWTRVVETEGATVRVNTKCKKCGEVMKPERTVHHDMR
jgi:hypothetical protein